MTDTRQLFNQTLTPSKMKTNEPQTVTEPNTNLNGHLKEIGEDLRRVCASFEWYTEALLGDLTKQNAEYAYIQANMLYMMLGEFERVQKDIERRISQS